MTMALPPTRVEKRVFSIFGRRFRAVHFFLNFAHREIQILKMRI